MHPPGVRLFNYSGSGISSIYVSTLYIATQWKEGDRIFCIFYKQRNRELHSEWSNGRSIKDESKVIGHSQK